MISTGNTPPLLTQHPRPVRHTEDAPRTPWVGRLRSLGLDIDAWWQHRDRPSVRTDVAGRQAQVLRRIVRHNRHTTFGLQHGFGTITGTEDFARRVPIMDDSGLLRWLRYRSEHDPRALTPAPRSWREAAASPLVREQDGTAQAQAELARLRRLSPAAFAGGIIVAAREENREWGVAGRLSREAQVLPTACWDITDSSLRDLLLLRLCLGRDDVTCLAGLDADGLRRWMHLLETQHRFLLRDLRQGGFFLADRLPAELAARLAPALGPQPERARELAHARRQTGALRPTDLWPALALWVTAPSAALETLLQNQLPAGVRVVERHFECDPLRRAVAVPVEGGACLPRLDSHYYEFVPCARWEAGDRDACGVAHLREGVDYQLIISGEHGLYRYFTGDALTVTGQREGLPLFRFRSPAPALRPALTGSPIAIACAPSSARGERTA